MNEPIHLHPSELSDFLLEVALKRPVFIWGAPGIGKSDLVEQFATAVGMECVSILGSQLAPEDLMGVPRIEDGFTKFFPPSAIARKEPYVLFLDELNACTPDVQKAFYSLILNQRIGEYTMPTGSVVIAAGNRASDGAIVRTLPTPLINRTIQIHLRPRLSDWLVWARNHGIHPLVCSFLEERPSCLCREPSKDQTPFSTPRAWHILSDCMDSMKISDNIPGDKARFFEAALFGTLSLQDANLFKTFIRYHDKRHQAHLMLKGKAGWPLDPEGQDWLVLLVDNFRDVLCNELPSTVGDKNSESAQKAFHAKRLIQELAAHNEELARVLLTPSESSPGRLPGWFLTEIIRDLPSLGISKDKKEG
jgi:AAA domain (dynein-related subfamily)